MPLLSKAFFVLSTLSASFPMAKQVVPERLRHILGQFLYYKALPEFPDRMFMRETIIPYILKRGASRVLSVGVQPYTVEITDKLTAGGAEVWTLDIDPETQPWGAPGRHIVGDAVRIDEIERAQGFSCILFNGVFGFGIDEPNEIGRTLAGLSEILPSGGLLVLGWNTDRIPDPSSHPEFRRFRPLEDESLSSRVTFPGSTHVYDFLEAVNPSAFVS